MRYRSIPRTSLKVSEIGFGCWTMGGPNWNPQSGQAIGWADPGEEEILAGVEVGLDAGVNHWDNADVYGNGVAERRLGNALRRFGVKRETQVIATKVGHFRGTAANAYEPSHIRAQCEQSLRNLRTDHIDLYYFHHGTYVGVDYDSRAHDYLHEAAATMHALVKEGKVIAIGQSAYTIEDYERAVPVVKPHVLQSKANLRVQEFLGTSGKAGRLLELMRRHDCVFVAFGPLDQGILLDKFDPEKPPKFEGEYRASRKDFNPETLRKVREKLAKVVERFGSGTGASGGRPTPPQPSPLGGGGKTAMLASVAQRWVLSHERVLCTIPGFRNAIQAACNVGAGSDPAMALEDVEWLRGLFGAG